MTDDVLPSSTTPRAITDSPFAGLNYYTENDSKWFFGREAERRTIVGNLRATRLTLLYADSGVGKSSLLRAAVASKLLELARKHRTERGSAQYIPILFTAWKDEPVDALIASVVEGVREFVDNELAPSSNRLDDVIKAAANAADATLLIILDQFEEYFLYRSNEASPGRFADEFARCVNDPGVRANFLISIREDAYSGLGDLFATRMTSVYGNYLHLEYLDRESAREAIEGPIGAFNDEHRGNGAIDIDPELTETVLDEVGRGKLTLGPGAQDGVRLGDEQAEHDGEIEAPFLQLVMRALWAELGREAGPRVLRPETLERLGGADKIVRTHLEDALATLEDSQLETATDVFHELVTPSGTKIAHTVADLANMTHHTPDEVDAVVKKLHDARVFRGVEPAPGMSEMRYELFHDRLARPLLDWLEVRDRERIQHEAEAEARNARKFRRRAIAIGLVALVAVALLIVAVIFRQQAINATHTAQSQLLADRATASTSRLALASLLAVESYRVAPTVDARSAILSVADSRELGAPIRGHTRYVYSAAFSPSGQALASGGADGTVRFWSVANHRQLSAALRAHAGTVYQVAYSPDGKMLATANADGTVRLWNVTSHQELGVLHGHQGTVYTVAFSPDGRTLASGGADKTVRLWNVAQRRQIGPPLRGHHGGVLSVAFSPDGKTVASGGTDRTIRLWDVKRHRARGKPLRGSRDIVFTVAFSPDGRTLASGGADNTIRLWHIVRPRQFAVLTGQTSTVHAVAFSPNGQTLASAGYDNTIRLWDVRTHQQLGLPLYGHESSVLGVSFSPNGMTVASASSDDTVRLWNVAVANGRELGSPLAGEQGSVQDVAFSPDRRTLVSGGADGPVRGDLRFWDLRTHQQLGQAIHLPKIVQSVAFSPDGRLVATGGGDFTIRLWRVGTRQQLGRPLGGHSGTVYQVAFSPSGQLLASGNARGTIEFWNVATRRPVGRPVPVSPGQPVESVAFSPNGTTLASGSTDAKVRLWGVSSHQLIAVLSGHQATVTSVAFSPDGKLLASGSTDGTVKLWSVQSHQQLASLTGSDWVEGVAFSPDGQTLAVGSADGTVQLWDVSSRRPLGVPLSSHTPLIPRPAASINAVAFSPTSSALASDSHDETVAAASADHTILLWTYHPIDDYLRQLCTYIDRTKAAQEWKQEATSISFRRPC